MTQANQFRVAPGGELAGTVRVPGDKSISHRALMLASIGNGVSRIHGFLDGDDCRATLSAMQSLGVDIEVAEDGAIRVTGVGMHGLRAPKAPLDLGNSGTGMRLLAGLLAGQPFSSTLIGDASLMKRPMGRVAAPLARMGARITTRDGCPPLQITGSDSLQPIDYTLPVASAQVKSAVLLAGLYAAGATRTVCPGVTRDHTERMLAGLGANIEIDSALHTVTLHGPATLQSIDWQVPGDFSSAAFFIVAALLAASDSLLIEHVGLNPTRTGLLDILQAMGARIEIVNAREIGGEPVGDLRVYRSELTGIDVPHEHVASAIDEFPVLFVAAALARGTTRLRGAEELRHKESDRIAVMAQALQSVGVALQEYPDGVDIVGGTIRGGAVDSCGDHRVAMAMTVAALGATETIDIANTAQVATSFPGFVATAGGAGIGIAQTPAG